MREFLHSSRSILTQWCRQMRHMPDGETTCAHSNANRPPLSALTRLTKGRTRRIGPEGCNSTRLHGVLHSNRSNSSQWCHLMRQMPACWLTCALLNANSPLRSTLTVLPYKTYWAGRLHQHLFARTSAFKSIQFDLMVPSDAADAGRLDNTCPSEC